MLVLLFCLVICACVLFLCSAILGKPYKSTVKSYNNNIYIIYIYIYIYIYSGGQNIYISTLMECMKNFVGLFLSAWNVSKLNN